jgi:tetratricopeptide (TPR) repeat protein
VEVWLSLGSAYLGKKDPKRTVVALRKAKQLKPDNVALRRPLVEALRASRDAPGADEERRAWLALAFPEVADTSRPRRERAELARKAAADERVPRALRGELRLLRAELLDQGGDTDGAEAALALAAKDAPWSYRVALTAGRLAEQSGKRRRALERYERAKRLAPNRAGPAVAVARAKLGQGDVASSLEELAAAVKANPRASSPVVELIRLLALRLEVGKAIEELRKARKRLADPALRELRSSRDFAALWKDGRFRELVGDPLPGRLGRAGGERLVETGQSAYFSSGELVE